MKAIEKIKEFITEHKAEITIAAVGGILAFGLGAAGAMVYNSLKLEAHVADIFDSTQSPEPVTPIDSQQNPGIDIGNFFGYYKDDNYRTLIITDINRNQLNDLMHEIIEKCEVSQDTTIDLMVDMRN